MLPLVLLQTPVDSDILVCEHILAMKITEILPTLRWEKDMKIEIKVGIFMIKLIMLIWTNIFKLKINKIIIAGILNSDLEQKT